MWANGSHDIKFISWRGVSTTLACYWGSQASPMRCTTAQAWRTPSNSRPSFVSPYSLQNNNFFNKCSNILFTELINNGNLHIEISCFTNMLIGFICRSRTSYGLGSKYWGKCIAIGSEKWKMVISSVFEEYIWRDWKALLMWTLRHC